MKRPQPPPKPPRRCGDCARAAKKTGSWFCSIVNATVRQHYAACPDFKEPRR